MLYISVDNDQHTYLALSIIKRLNVETKDITFISHNSPRNNYLDSTDYKKVKQDGHPLSDGSGFKKISTYLRTYKHHKNLKEQFQFTKNDVLLIITEYQINNAIFAKQMKKAGGKVYIFDEGVGFYFNNCLFFKTNKDLKSSLLLLAYNFCLIIANVPAVAKKGLESRMHITIKDNFIDAIYSSMKIAIDRKCTIRGYQHFLIPHDDQGQKKKDVALFFANNLDSFHVKKEEMLVSEQIIINLCKTFSKVYIKIHPFDWTTKSDLYYLYINLAAKFENAEMIDNSIVGNEAIMRTKPSIVVGSMGAAIFDAFFFECQPVFFYHLLPPVKEFEVCTSILNSINYNFINSIDEINPNYSSGVKLSDISYPPRDFQF